MPPARSSSRWILIPVFVFLLLAAAWTGLWFYTANTTEQLMSGWIEREARAGRIYSCPDRKLGGFPFRIEVTCRNPQAEFRASEPPLTVQSKELVAVAQVYTPGLVIAEITGPLRIQGAPGSQAFVANWKLLQASLRGSPTDLKRLSLAADALTLARSSGSGEQQALTAERLEIHVRPGEPTQSSSGVLDIALSATAATLPLVGSALARPFDATVTASLGGTDATAGDSLPVRLREWQAAGGRLEITAARVQQGNAIVLGSGVIGLNRAGKLDGTLDLRLTGLRPVAAVLFGEENAPRVEAALQAGLLLLGGRTEVEGKNGYALPLRFSDGTIFLGPVRAGQTPAFF